MYHTQHKAKHTQFYQVSPFLKLFGSMASPKALPLLCLLSFLFLFSFPDAEAAKADFFYLTLLWPGTLCSNSKCCMPTTGEPAADFSVQALESYDSTTGQAVTNCSTSCRFFVNSLGLFIGDMYAHWPDLSCPCNNGVDLWRSTWCKYGTCSNLTQKQYFQAALNLSAKIDLLNVLAFCGIVPSKNYYKLEDIQNSLMAKYGFSTMVECSKSGWFWWKKYDQLSKVQFCVSADAQRLISCPISRSSNCDAQVKFPPFTVNMLEPCLGSKLATMLSAEKDLVM